MGATCPVSIRGVVYPSQKEAAAALGVTPGAIAQSLLRNGHCDKVGLGTGKVGNDNANMNEVTIGPFQFRSQLQASKLLNVPRTTIRRYCDGTIKSRGKEIVMRAAMKALNDGSLMEHMR